MSEESIERMRRELLPKVYTAAAQGGGEAWLKELFERLSRDCAETVYLTAIGKSARVVGETHDRFLIEQLAAVRSSLIENGITDSAFVEKAMTWTGDAFHRRFMELDAARCGVRQ